MASAIISMVVLTSCARTPIEEISRKRLKDKANNALAIYSRILQDTDRDDRALLSQRLNAQLPGVYSVTWADDGQPLADIYLRDNVTVGSGFWAEHRTVSACIRYSYDTQSAAMKSIDCPATGIQSTHTDERVTIP